LYFFDDQVSNFAEQVLPSRRGELEITSLLQMYLNHGNLTVTRLSRGTAWLDTGTVDDLHNAASYIRVVEQRTGLKIGCIEEIAFSMNWIDERTLYENAISMNNEYGKYLLNLLGDYIAK
jgi:glucose-1-phosphate thymidylyltransferase